MNNYQKAVKGLQVERLINLGFMKIALGTQSAHGTTPEAKRDIEKAEQENRQTDKEMEEHFAYNVWESIKLGLPF